MPIPNKSVAAESMLKQGVDQQVSSPHAVNLNATAFTPSVCRNVELNSCNNPLSSDTHSSRDDSYITALLSLHGSVKDESLASLIQLLIDCVRRVNDLCSGVDSEAIKQSILDIESVVQKVASLCEGEHMKSIFIEVSQIAHVSTRRLGDRLSYLRQVSDLDQRLFKNRKDLCNFITEV